MVWCAIVSYAALCCAELCPGVVCCSMLLCLWCDVHYCAIVRCAVLLFSEMMVRCAELYRATARSVKIMTNIEIGSSLIFLSYP